MGLGIPRSILIRFTGWIRSKQLSVPNLEECFRKRMAVSVRRQLGGRPAVETKPNLADSRLEMELLLFNLVAAGNGLSAALEAEVRVGDQFFNPTPAASSSLNQWIEARQAVLTAQIAYERAAQDYRSFIGSLAPPLRAAAAAKGTGPMALTYTFHHC